MFKKIMIGSKQSSPIVFPKNLFQPVNTFFSNAKYTNKTLQLLHYTTIHTIKKNVWQSQCDLQEEL